MPSMNNGGQQILDTLLPSRKDTEKISGNAVGSTHFITILKCFEVTDFRKTGTFMSSQSKWAIMCIKIRGTNIRVMQTRHWLELSQL